MKKEKEIFYGELIETETEFLLTYDKLRNKGRYIPKEKILSVHKTQSETILETEDRSIIYVNNPSIRCSETDLKNLTLNDKNILQPRSKNIFVVQLHKLNMKNKDKYYLIHQKILNGMAVSSLNTPLTIAFQKRKDGVYVGYWDILKNVFATAPILHPCQPLLP